MADICLLLSQSSFVQDPAYGSVYFGKSLFKTSAEDFSRIADLMGVGQHFQFGDQK